MRLTTNKTVIVLSAGIVLLLGFYLLRRSVIDRGSPFERINTAQENKNGTSAENPSAEAAVTTPEEIESTTSQMRFQNISALLDHWGTNGYPDYYSGYLEGYLALSENTESVRKEILSSLEELGKLKFTDSPYSQNEREQILQEMTNRLPELLGDKKQYVYWLSARNEYYSSLAARDALRHQIDHGGSSQGAKVTERPDGEYKWGIVLGIDEAYMEEITDILKAEYGDYLMLTVEAWPWTEKPLVIKDAYYTVKEP